MKKCVSIFLAAILLFAVTGCSEKNYDPSNVEHITLVNIEPDPASYRVFVATPDCMAKEYDFTRYWMDNSFDYFSDPLPHENEYELREWRISENTWDIITETLKENRFFAMPDEMRPVNGADFGSYYIEVESDGLIHKSGGYGAGYNQDSASKRFKIILNEIIERLKADDQSANVIGFNFLCPAGDHSYTYTIKESENGFVLECKGPTYFEVNEMVVDQSVLAGLHEIIIEHNIKSWNGFNERAPDDKYTTANGMFLLDIVFDDGTMVMAQGDHAYPEGYNDAEAAILKYFDDLIKSKLDPEE